MAKIAIILPHKDLSTIAHSLVRVMHVEDPIIIDYNDDYGNIPQLVEQIKRQGADIVLTRGLISNRVRQCCDLPVVDMRLTAQEMGLLIQRAKALTRHKPPTIAIIGTGNMFCDYSRMSELFDVNLTSYWVSSDDPDPHASMKELTLSAIRDHVDVIIGGTTACQVAQEHNIPAIFLTATSDSVQEGLRIAKQVSYAINLEKNNAAEIQTMLDTSFSILIRFDRNGYITTVNQAAVTRLEQKSFAIIGKPLLSLIKGIPQQQLQQVLLSGKTLFSSFISIGANQFVANIMPIRNASGVIIGGVLSCDEINRIETVSADIRREQRRLRHPALHSFADLTAPTDAFRSLHTQAQRFAQSDSPVFIRSEPGCHPEYLAEAIHNASDRQEMPFVTANCGELSHEEQLRILFGSGQTEHSISQSMCALAHMGTLYLQAPETLCPQAQNRLFRLLTQKSLLNTQASRPYPLDVRVIVSTQCTAQEWSTLPSFDPGLRMLLSGLPLELPSLRHSPEHLTAAFQESLAKYCKRYQRTLTVTAGGTTWLSRQDWPGNYVHLDRFCELLVLSAPRRYADENLLATLYRKTVPAIPLPSEEALAHSTSAEVEKLKAALAKNLGNRSATAQDLGISTSTLWRKLKKYNISP